MKCSPRSSGAEHGITDYPNSSGGSCSASTRTSPIHDLSPTNSVAISSGLAVASIDRRHTTRVIAFSPISDTSLRTYSTHLVEQAADGGLLDVTFRIDSSDIVALPWNGDASWNYDPTAEEFYCGFGCTAVTTGPNTDCCGIHRRKARETEDGDARQRDALAAKQPIWMLGDGAYDLLDWHDHLLEAGVMLVTPHNPRNTDYPLDIDTGSKTASTGTATTFG